MIMLILQKVAVVLLLAVLVFNLTQRKHLARGEGKRFASLFVAGFLLAFYGVTFLYQRFGIPPIFLAPFAAIEVGVAFLLRDRIFVFRARCAACGVRLPIERILYVDAALCEECSAEVEAAARASFGYSQDAENAPRRVEDVDWERWTPTEQAVLCFIREDERLMLIEKRRGLGAGKVNGPGGRIEPGESAEEAAIREVQEEIHLTPSVLSQRAELSFIFTDGYSLRCFVFVASAHNGTPGETPEALPFWCAIEEIPYDKMWADDRFWLPRVLNGDYVVGRFIFDEDTMLSHEVITA
jgi:8-oxo-dGTP diphosphatase